MSDTRPSDGPRDPVLDAVRANTIRAIHFDNTVVLELVEGDRSHGMRWQVSSGFTRPRRFSANEWARAFKYACALSDGVSRAVKAAYTDDDVADGVIGRWPR